MGDIKQEESEAMDKIIAAFKLKVIPTEALRGIIFAAMGKPYQIIPTIVAMLSKVLMFQILHADSLRRSIASSLHGLERGSMSPGRNSEVVLSPILDRKILKEI